MIIHFYINIYVMRIIKYKIIMKRLLKREIINMIEYSINCYKNLI